MLKVEDLHVHYGRVAAVRGISFEIKRGEVVALIGPNGAGKSTTLAAIIGAVRPSAGTITYEGAPITGDAPEKSVRRGIALVPEGRHIFNTLTVAENLQLGATCRSDRAVINSDLERVLERFPILRKTYRSPAGRLSGGEQQQLAIGRALLSRPSLMLLDEPSLGLAPLVIDLVFEILSELREEQITILLVEQVAKRAVEFSDHAYVLRTGRIVASGTRDEMTRDVNLAEAYLGVGG
jgi:branched-chain amino acid transport system ATP-binding protein